MGWGGAAITSFHLITSMNATLPTSLGTCNYVSESYVAYVPKNFQLCA